MDYEKAFSDFLDTKEFDNAERALFEITRQAFKAGWSAACEGKASNKIIDIKQTDK